MDIIKNIFKKRLSNKQRKTCAVKDVETVAECTR